MEGCEYKSSKDIGGKDFRLMLVDRAVNGWDEYRGTGTNAKERFATSSIQNLLNNPAALTHGKDRFEWIAVDAEHNIARNCVRGRNRQRAVCGWRLLPFQTILGLQQGNLGRAVRRCNQLAGALVSENCLDKPLQNAPHKGGNPSEAWRKMQREACAQLLRAEIVFFNPTHILFVTGTMQTAD